VGRQGAIEVLDLDLDAAEQAGFAASAQTLRDKLAQVEP
jgi:malate/lactate dehydrogenase